MFPAKTMFSPTMFLGALALAAALVGCATSGEGEGEGEGASCDRAATPTERLSCELGEPVTDDGLTVGQIDPSEIRIDDGAHPRARCQTYYSACTPPWGGCTTVRAGAFSFTVCGPRVRAWVETCNNIPVGWGSTGC